MGSKIVHIFRYFLILLIISVALIPNSAFANDNTHIVRVGISNNNFKSLVYSEISIISTSDWAIYEKQSKKQILKLTPDDVLKVKYSNNSFELFVREKSQAKNLSDTLVVDCPKGLIGVENHKRNNKQALYHGVFELTPKNLTQFYLINVLDLENYLKGVVPNEMPVRFGLEALKAQAVAARNYVLMPRTRAYSEFEVDDSVASQVYFGAATESELSNKAVEQTKGLVALYNWDLILAQYCSTAGGYTESYENAFSDPKTKDFPAKSRPYLKGRPDIISTPPLNTEEEARLFYMGYPDSYDMKSPYYRWQKEWTSEELQKVLSKTLIDQSKTGFVKPAFKSEDTLNEIKELKVLRRGVSGKIMELQIVTDKEIYHVYKELVIRRLFQKNDSPLPSANLVFEQQYNADKKLAKIVAYGGGFGHGVGMSQFGAGFMATSLNKTFDKILKRYYTGITISTIPTILSANESQQSANLKFFAPYKKAVLVLDNKYQIDCIKAKINGKDVSLELDKSLVPAKRINRINLSEYIKVGENNVTFYYPMEEGNKKGIRLYIELVEKDDNEYSF